MKISPACSIKSKQQQRHHHWNLHFSAVHPVVDRETRKLHAQRKQSEFRKSHGIKNKKILCAAIVVAIICL